MIKNASMCIDLLFFTPKEVYVNGSHALFVRESLILTAGVVIEIMISYYVHIYWDFQKKSGEMWDIITA